MLETSSARITGTQPLLRTEIRGGLVQDMIASDAEVEKNGD